MNDQWLDFAIRIQSIAQAGLQYGKDQYDKESYNELRKIAAAHSFYDVRPALFKSKGPVSLPDFCLAGCGRDCSCFIPAAYGYP